MSTTELVKGGVSHERAGIRYEAVGSGEPVVLVHGLSGSSRWWKHNVQALAEHFHVHTVNLIGFGSSRRSGRFMLDEAAEHLRCWMSELGMTRAHFVGHSMGGLICAELAAMAPERVARLVLVNATIMPFEWGYKGHSTRLARALPRVPLTFLAVLATDTLRAGPWGVWQAARQLLRADPRLRLDCIEAPTLAIWGADDEIVPVAFGEQLVSLVPGARLEIIAGAGHVPMWQRPKEFNRLVIEFLQESGLTPENGPGVTSIEEHYTR